MQNSVKVIIRNPQQHIAFILQNHLYSRKASEFTIPELQEEMQQYGITSDVKPYIMDMVKNGQVGFTSHGFRKCRMV